MSVVELLSSLAKKDIRLWLEGENLRFSAPEGAFTPEIRDQIIAAKPEIIEFLKQAQKLKKKGIEKAPRDGGLLANDVVVDLLGNVQSSRLFNLKEFSLTDFPYGS